MKPLEGVELSSDRAAVLRIDCWQANGEEEMIWLALGSSEKGSSSGYILWVEQNYRIGGLDMRKMKVIQSCLTLQPHGL